MASASKRCKTRQADLSATSASTACIDRVDTLLLDTQAGCDLLVVD